MAEAFIVRRGGGGSGGTLVVTSSGAGTVTVSNSTLGKSYSKSVTAGGSVTFKGLKTGEWTVTLSNGAQTATRSVTINADYSVSVAYFSATISVTYPATSTCVVTNSGGQTVASDTNTGSSTKTWTATVNATGTYAVTATATDGSGKSKSTTVNITTDGQSESVTLGYILYIFRSGSGLATGCTFKNVESSSSSSNSLIANTASDYSNGSSFYITTNINFDGYSKLNFDLVGYKYTGPYDPSPHVIYGCSSNTNVTGNNKVPSASNYTASSTALPTTHQTVSVDISSVSNNDKYVKVETLDTRLVIYNIWLD